MIIASFNVNSIRTRIPILERWLKNRKPDVLCLQETKVIDKDFPMDAIRSFGYDAVYRGEKSYNGVAILSRHSIGEVFYGFDGAGNEDGSRLISARINGIHIVNSYVPQGTDLASEKFQYKLNWFARLRDYFSMRFSPEDHLLWTGDFNVAPEPMDVHNPKRLLGSIGYHPDEHKALKAVKEWGFVDVFRMHKPSAGEYTFWDYRVKDAIGKGLGWRVDHVWSTEVLAARSTDAWIDVDPRRWERPSDHSPIAVEFKD